MIEDFSEREARRILRGSILRAANEAWLRGRIPFTQIVYIALGRSHDREEVKKVREEVKFLIGEGYLAGEKRDAADNEFPEFLSLTNEGRKLFTGDRKDDAVLI